MRDYSIARSSFWTGQTGRSIRGSADAQRLAFYLITAPVSNMIGLYYLPLPTICHEIGITTKGASKALKQLGQCGFATYDFATEWVWVCEMARYQLCDHVSKRDNRHKSILRQLTDARKSPFLPDFWKRYGGCFELPDIETVRGLEGASKGGQSPTVPDPVPDQDPDLNSSLEVDEFFDVWNGTAGTVRMVKLTDKRRKSIAARIEDADWHWREALAKFPLKCFASDPDGWQPDIEFFLRSDSVTKILEGKYDWVKSNGKQRSFIGGAGQTFDPKAARTAGVGDM